MQVITLKWKGEEYTLNETEVFLAADAVEQVITVGELVGYLGDMSKIRFVKLSMAYGALLREAGVAVQDMAIHKEFKQAFSSDDAAEKLALAQVAILNLVSILMDEAPQDGGGDEGGKKTEVPAS